MYGLYFDYGCVMDCLRISLPDFNLNSFTNKDIAPPEAQHVLAKFGSEFQSIPPQKIVLACFRAPHAQHFMQVVPTNGLGQHMSTLEYRVILKCWLMILFFLQAISHVYFVKSVLGFFWRACSTLQRVTGFKYRHD
ncbi:hypothetical protein R6Q59_029744 [Mikania micrantha]